MSGIDSRNDITAGRPRVCNGPKADITKSRVGVDRHDNTAQKVNPSAHGSVHADGLSAISDRVSIAWRRQALQLVKCILNLHGLIVQASGQRASRDWWIFL